MKIHIRIEVDEESERFAFLTFPTAKGAKKMSFPLFLHDAGGNLMKYRVPVIFSRSGATWSAQSSDPSTMGVSIDASAGQDSGEIVLVMECLKATASDGSAPVTVSLSDSTGGNKPIGPVSWDIRDSQPQTPISGLDLDGASASGVTPGP